MTRVEITTEYIKLDSFLKLCGAAETGGTAKLMIAGGEVSVDGERCLARGKKLRPGQRVSVGGDEFEVTGCGL